MTDKTRAEFEAWAAEHSLIIFTGKNEDGQYIDMDCKPSGLEDMWQAWQAALATKASSPLGRDADWALAMAEALDSDSGYSVPIVPSPDAFRALFAAVRATKAAPEPVAPVAFHDVDQPNGIAWCPGYPKKLRDITPLYTTPPTAPLREPAEWQPIETAPRDVLVDILMPENRRYAGCHWDSICGEFRNITHCGTLIRLRGATHWMPLPAAPTHPAQAEKKEM